MRRINYQTDFSVSVTLTDANGDAMTPPTSNAWYLHFTDSAGTCFKCGFDGTNYESCSIDDGAVICYIDNPGYVPGALTVTFRNDVINANFGDGYENQVIPVDDELWLVEGASDGAGDLAIEMAVTLLTPVVTAASVDSNGDLLLTINYEGYGNND